MAVRKHEQIVVRMDEMRKQNGKIIGHRQILVRIIVDQTPSNERVIERL